MSNINDIRRQIENVQATVEDLLEVVKYDAETGHLMDELIGVALPNLRAAAGMPIDAE